MTGKCEWFAVRTAENTPKLKYYVKIKVLAPPKNQTPVTQHTAKNITNSITVAVPVFNHLMPNNL
jgi:hypothetical protein